VVWIGGGGIALSLFMLWAGTAGAELFVQRVSLVLMLVSVVIYFFGARIIQLWRSAFPVRAVNPDSANHL
jgi:hypothetical protein